MNRRAAQWAFGAGYASPVLVYMGITLLGGSAWLALAAMAAAMAVICACHAEDNRDV